MFLKIEFQIIDTCSEKKILIVADIGLIRCFQLFKLTGTIPGHIIPKYDSNTSNCLQDVT